ncbi:putative choline transporter-like protein 2-like [Apostichopus japonicus]|uniref:Choline transporter-like protein n=1 Tax=Stichopus japonicus TaxID=307972 RepID=A0A2G8LAM9_STIJA|nr:putative choline transporter-like protein 2-like [Apostichopus japonicus]
MDIEQSCTDIICLILFILYFIGMIAVGIIAFTSGDPRRLVYPTDSNGTICGIDEIAIDKPFLVYFDLTKCSPTKLSCDTPQVCVSECPKKYWFPIPEAEYLDKLNLTVDQIGEPICLDGVDPAMAGFDQEQAIQDNKCAPYVLNSTDVFNRCLPEFIFRVKPDDAFLGQLISIISDSLESASGGVIDEEKIQSGIDFVAGFGGSALVIVEDIRSSWHIILIGIGIGCILCFLWCAIMRFIAGFMVWGSILVLNCLLGAGTALCFFEYRTIRDTETQMEEFRFTLDINYYLRLEKTWLIGAIACGSLFVILLLLTLCLCNRIRIAIALIQEASKSVNAFYSTLFWPLFPFILEMFVIALWALITLYLATATNDEYNLNDLSVIVTNRSIENVQTIICGRAEGVRTIEVLENATDVFCTSNSTYNVSFKYLQFFNLFGFLWLLNFIIGFSHLVLAGTFATYYWTFDKKNIPRVALGGSIWRACRYHLGSIAFGAAIIAIIQFIRILLEYLEVQLKKGKENPVVKYTLKCLKCLFWCLEKFMKFINKNAYIMVAIYGKNFCKSAQKAFFLLMRNIVRVAVVNKITDFLLFLGTLMVTAAIVLIAFFFFAFGQDYAVTSFIATDVINVPSVRYYWVIIFVIAVGTFVVAKLFFGVFDMAVDTLFLCFLEDLERNDGSADRPYFMGKNLMNIVGKKNKLSKEEEW